MDRKPLLMFSPKYLKDGFGFLSFTTVIRKPNYVDYEAFRFVELKKKLPLLPEKAIEYIHLLTDASLQEHQKLLYKALKNIPSGQDLESLIQKKITRHINEAFLEGVKHWHLVPWYHHVIDLESKKQVKCACYFLNEKIKLRFKVEYSDEQGLQLIQYVSQGSVNYLMSDFRRSLFLLEHKHQYFVLSPNDYATLDWIAEMNVTQLAFRPKDFLLNIVWKLEEKGYELDRNDCFKSQKIATPPQAMVLISEISNTFLQFIPCWNYDGIRIEGAYQPTTEVQRQGELYLVNRDKEDEAQLIHSIRSRHPSFVNQFNGNFFIHFDEAKKNNWFFNLYQQWIEDGVQLLGLDLLEHFRYSVNKADTQLTWIKSEGGITTFEMEVKFGKEKIKNKELQKIIQAGQKSIFLKDNTIGILTDEWLSMYALMIKHAKVKGVELEVSNWLLQSNLQIFHDDQKENVVSEAWQKKWTEWQFGSTEIYPVPEKVHAKLRPYQHKGYEWMALLSEMQSGACLADDMGLGKTLQTISFLCWLNESHPDYRFMIICPSSLIYNWKSELEKFAPHLAIRIFKGGVSDLADFYESQAQILISSYGLVRTQIELLENNIWGGIVVDESHNIKNPSALITRAIGRLTARHRIALSGTPVMNNTFDLYAQLEFIVPGLLGSQEFFRKEYANPIDKDGDQQKTKTLARITAPFILRRTKKQVATDLPEKTESILWCEMEDSQRAAYEEIKSNIRNSVFLNIRNDGFAKSKIGILAGITKLKQVCCSPILINEYKGSKASSIKLNVLIDEIQTQLTDSKALVFSQFKGMLHLIAHELRHAGIPYYHFDGDTDILDRRDMVDAFQQQEDQAKVFLISLKAGNTGLNLTAADYVFLVDPWWNSAVENQAIDRTHRIGQTKHVMAYRMICKDTIEERIMSLQKRKGEISDELVHAEDGFVKNLSVEDVEYLFS